MPAAEMKVNSMAPKPLGTGLEVIGPEKHETEKKQNFRRFETPEAEELKSEIFTIPTELKPLLIVLHECGETLAEIEQSDLDTQEKIKFRAETEALVEEFQRQLKVKGDKAFKKPEVVSAPAVVPTSVVVSEGVSDSSAITVHDKIVSGKFNRGKSKFKEFDEEIHKKFIALVMLRIRIQDEILDLVAKNELEGCGNKSRAFSRSIPNHFSPKIINIQDLRKFYYTLCGESAAINNDQNLKRAVVKLDLMLQELNHIQNELKGKWYHRNREVCSYNDILDSVEKELKGFQDQQEAKIIAYITQDGESREKKKTARKRDRCLQECQELEKKRKSRSVPSISASLKQLELGSLEESLRKVSELYQEKPCSEAFKKAKEAVEIYVYIELQSMAPEKYQSVCQFLLKLEEIPESQQMRDCLAHFLKEESKKPVKDKNSIDYYRSYSFFQCKEVRGKTETRRLLEDLLKVLDQEIASKSNIQFRSLHQTKSK